MLKNNKIIFKILIFIVFFSLVLMVPKIEYGVSYIQLGDADNDSKIDVSDILLILRHVSASETNKNTHWILKDNNYKAADVNQDEKIDVLDILYILRYIAANNDNEIAARHKEWCNLGKITSVESQIETKTQTKTNTQTKTENKTNTITQTKTENKITTNNNKKTQPTTQNNTNNKTEKNTTIQVTGINVAKEAKLEKGKSATLKVNIAPTNAKKPNLRWTSSNTNVAKIDSSTGKITALQKGSTIITATSTENNKIKASCNLTVTEPVIAVNSIKLNSTKIQLEKGKATTIKATITPTNATNKTIIWSTSNSKVVKVKNGKITAVGAGTATITAKSNNGKTSTCEVVVKDSVKGLSLKLNGKEIKSGGTIELDKNKTIKLSIKANPNTAQVYGKIENTKIAQIDKNVNIKGINGGNTKLIITVKTKTETKNYAYKIKVNIPVEKLQILYNNKPINGLTIGKGDSTTISSKVLPDNATNKKVKWKTSNKKIVTIKNGKITAKKVGKATIKLVSTENSKVLASCYVIVKNKVSKVTLNKTNLTLYPGGKEKLVATVTPKDAIFPEVTWSTSNSNIVSVNNGQLEAKSSGIAVITAKTKNGVQAKCIVTVRVPLNNILLSTENKEIKIGESYTLNVTTVPVNASNIKTIRWESSNQNVAYLKDNSFTNNVGKVSIVGRNYGRATITVTATTLDGKQLKKMTDIIVKK